MLRDSVKTERSDKQKQFSLSSTSNWWKGKVNLLTTPEGGEGFLCVNLETESLCQQV